MLVPRGFTSWSNYGSFALARDFISPDRANPFVHQPNLAERLGHLISRPLLQPANLLVREIKNPLVVLALTVAAIAFISFLFYPAQCLWLIGALAPPLTKVELWMGKALLFGLIETAILGVGLRMLGRLSNANLLAAWQSGAIEALHLGRY